MDALKKVEKELDTAAGVAMQLGFYRTILVLNLNYGWKKLRIERFLDKASEIYGECRGDSTKSLVQMCDEETGIEVRNENGESYLNTTYLCQEKWDQEKPKFERAPAMVQKSYYISVRQHMKKWMYAQIMASIILALHRKEGWSFDRIERFLTEHDKLKEQGQSIEQLKECVENRTGMKYVYTGSDLCLVNKELKGITEGKQ